MIYLGTCALAVRGKKPYGWNEDDGPLGSDAQIAASLITYYTIFELVAS